jgi:hypothetical protein
VSVDGGSATTINLYAPSAQAQIAAMERDVDGAEALVLAELCDLQRRLRDLEGSIQQLGRRVLTVQPDLTALASIITP